MDIGTVRRVWVVEPIIRPNAQENQPAAGPAVDTEQVVDGQLVAA